MHDALRDVRPGGLCCRPLALLPTAWAIVTYPFGWFHWLRVLPAKFVEVAGIEPASYISVDPFDLQASLLAEH